MCCYKGGVSISEHLAVDPGSPVPPFEQLRQQLADRVADGTLAPGTQLPTVRGLAAQLGLAPNTVARTYRELEQGGLIRTAGRRGTVVAHPADDTSAEAERTTDRFVATMRGLGVSGADAVRLVHRAYGGSAQPVRPDPLSGPRARLERADGGDAWQ